MLKTRKRKEGERYILSLFEHDIRTFVKNVKIEWYKNIRIFFYGVVWSRIFFRTRLQQIIHVTSYE